MSETRFVGTWDGGASPPRPAEAGVTIHEETTDADTAAKTASPTTKLRALMILPFAWGNESEDRSRGTPRNAARRDRRAVGRRLPLSSRASLFGSAGEKANVAPSSGFLNAAVFP